MSLIDGYKASLKPLEVEEPIDVFVHRPLGYLVALASFRTPISPDLITLASIVVGMAAGLCIVWPFPYHLPVAGLLIFASAVLDCADGQLARMRKTSSAFGRMIDGVADLFVTSAVVPATVYLLWQLYDSDPWLAGTVVGLGICTIVTSSFHTGMYDHYKNVYLHLTHASYKDGEDYETARARWEKSSAGQPGWKRFAWRIYLFYIKSQADYVAGFDPYTSVRLGAFPPHDPERALIYRKHNEGVMRVWRSMFGFGSLVFGLAVFVALGRPDVYLALRLVVLNGIFYLYLRPAQRRASRRAFEQMGIRMPDQKWSERT
jgi:hypothetical protein